MAELKNFRKLRGITPEMVQAMQPAEMIEKAKELLKGADKEQAWDVPYMQIRVDGHCVGDYPKLGRSDKGIHDRLVKFIEVRTEYESYRKNQSKRAKELLAEKDQLDLEIRIMLIKRESTIMKTLRTKDKNAPAKADHDEFYLHASEQLHKHSKELLRNIIANGKRIKPTNPGAEKGVKTTTNLNKILKEEIMLYKAFKELSNNLIDDINDKGKKEVAEQVVKTENISLLDQARKAVKNIGKEDTL